MEILNLSKKLCGTNLKFKSKATEQISFVSRIFQEHGHYCDENTNSKNSKLGK